MGLTQGRLRFDGVEVLPEGHGLCKAAVKFTFAGKDIQTSSIAAADGTGPLRAAASATLKALQLAVGKRFSCRLEDLDRVNALGKDLVAVLVNIEYDERKFQLFGSCRVAGDEAAAAVRAVLNATNRFVDLAIRN